MRRSEKILILLLTLSSSFLFKGCSGENDQPPYKDTSLPVEQRVSDLVSRLTLDEKLGFLYVTQPAIPRLDIGEYHYGNEALHGIVRRNGQATVFPQAIALAATWNPDLMYDCATAISDEARAKHNANEGKMKGGEIWGGQFDGLLTFFSPTINMARDPRWGRTSETYGEDPFLTGRMAKAFITGMQGNHEKYLKTICTPKHYVANNEEHNRFEANAVISEKTLREYYLPAYKTSITDAGAGALMSAYNAVNGIPCTANKWLLTDIVRNEWNFKGYIVCDCGAIKHLYESHNYADNPLEAAVMALKAGIDLECGGKKDLASNIKTALEKDLITMDDVDRAVSNILKGRFQLGMFDPSGQVPFDTIPPKTVGSKKHQELALQAARESLVLLRNGNNGKEGLLPIDKNEKRKILIVGPNANVSQFGERNYSGVPVIDPVTPLEGIRQVFGNRSEIIFIPWMDLEHTEQFVPLGKAYLPDREEAGFSGSYYHNEDFSGEPKFKRTDPVINFDWKNMPPDPFLPDKEFSIKWNGLVKNTVSGEYWFKIMARGKYELFINNRKLLAGVNSDKIISDSVMIDIDKLEEINIRINFSGNTINDPVCRLLWKIDSDEPDFFNPYRKEAGNADIVMAFMGLDSETVVESRDREDLDLPAEQLDFVKKLHALNKNVVVVLINGNPLSVNWIDKNIPSVIEAWFPGEAGGTAIAEVLSGDYNPAGRLPLTFYTSVDQLPPFDSYEISRGHTYMFLRDRPLYPFGHGLSYTNFEYSEMSLNKINDSLQIKIKVKNTGNFNGDEVVQLYFRKENPQPEDPEIKLFAFERIHVKKDEEKVVTFSLDPESTFIEFSEKEEAFLPLPGKIILFAGPSSAELPVKSEFEF